MAAKRKGRTAERRLRISRTERRAATQTKKRDLLIVRAEVYYADQVALLKRKSQNLIDEWLASQVNQGLIYDSDEEELLRRVRGLFKEPANTRAFFGRMSTLVDQDVIANLTGIIPTVNRAKLVAPKALTKFTQTNAGLIKNIGDLATDRIAKFLAGGAEGRHVEALQKEFETAFDVSASRAELWARDQTLKLHANLTQERHTQVGISRYYWTDSNDQRVREQHAINGDQSDSGVTFAYDDPPLIATEPEERYGNPGEDYECRCTAYPDISA